MDNTNRWSIVITVYDQYEFFRQLFESLIYNISAKEIIVVDDYSWPQGKLRQYQDYIEGKYDYVKVIKEDEYRVGFHANQNDKNIDREINRERNLNLTVSNRGHRYAIHTGLQEVNTEFVLILDADCVMLSKSRELLEKLTAIFDEDSNCMCIGQAAGIMSCEIKKIWKNFSFSYKEDQVDKRGGCPGSPAVACRMAGWNEHEIQPMLNKTRGAGWAYVWYAEDVFKKGFNITNFPIMSDPYIFHIGGGIFCFTRGGRRQDMHLGMLQDTGQYAGRVGCDILNEWYGGRYILNMKSKDYVKILQERYKRPFEELQPRFDEGLLSIPKHENKPKIIKENNL